MASVTDQNDEKAMAPDEMPGQDDEPRDDGLQKHPLGYRAPGPKEPAPSAGFFTIYKKGQGYWTRLASTGGAVLVILLTAHFLYTQLPPYIQWLTRHRNVLIGIVLAFLAGAALLTWRILNKPQNVDFLIATDSEMKKVNWTSRRDLVGSTKVVIMFMFLIAAFLFAVDVAFGYLFWLVKVLKSAPF